MNILKILRENYLEIFQDNFKRYLAIFLFFITTIAFYQAYIPKKSFTQHEIATIHFFFHPNCHHCKAQKEFNANLIKQFSNISIIEHDVSKPAENQILRKYAKEHGLNDTQLGVPFTIVGERYFIGYDTEGTTAKDITEAIANNFATPKGNSHVNFFKKNKLLTEKVELPLFGEINVANTSLIGLSIILGLVDGFNPCAMWVLAYLISIILGLGDKRKIWLLVGSFLLASGILYFLFITAWLNVFLLVGYLRFVIILIAIFALWVGINEVRDFLLNKEIVCNVGSPGAKKKTIDRVNRLVSAQISIATIFGIIALAFAVNSIEFVCSSALPVIFTQTLAIHNLSMVAYYFYITVYVFFFMLDDMVIFSIAAIAATQTAGYAYTRFSKIAGGVVLVGLGVFLLLDLM